MRIVCGAIGLDRIDSTKVVPKSELAALLGLPSNKPWGAVTYHPVTLEHDTNGKSLRQVLDAIQAYPDVFFTFTKANADADGRMINSMIAEFTERSGHAVLFDSLGSQTYLSVMAASSFVMGNSSSGIIEAPFLCVPTIDIGSRQQGRVRGTSVIRVGPKRAEIIKQSSDA